MFNFFRKTRKSLLGSGQARKYILYALGEITLVVIGILIALQVDTWNSRAIERSEERSILQNLHDDFGKNLLDINQVFDRNKKALESTIYTIQLVGLNSEQLKLHNIDSLLLASLDYAHISPSSNALTDLIGSGRLSRLHHLKIKSDLYSWTTELRSVERAYEGWQQNVNERLLPFLMGRYPFRDIGESYHTVVNYPRKKSALDVDKLQVFHEIEFENLLDDLIYRMQIYLNELTVLRQTAESIIAETSDPSTH